MKSLYYKLAFSNILKNRRIYFPYIFSSILLFAMSYIIVSLANNPSFMQTVGGNVVVELLTLGEFVIYIFAVIFLFYTNSFMINSRKKELGLYNVLGLSKSNVVAVVFGEFLYTLILTLGLGLTFGIIFEKLAFMILLNIMQDSVPLGFNLSTQAILIVTVFYTILLFACFLYNAFEVKRYTAVNLLKSESYGEKEPKAKVILALIGFVCLAMGYYIAIIVKDPISAVAFFFIAVILVIIGTYLLFTVGITLILKILKRNRHYYYQTSHFISVSMLLYRMKKNAVGLANICILSTMVLVMISSTSALWFYCKDSIARMYPNDMLIRVNGIKLDEVEKADNIFFDEISKSSHEITAFKPYYDVQRAYLYTGGSEIKMEGEGSDLRMLHVITLDTYNDKMNQNIKLYADEIMIFDEDGYKFDDTISIFGHRYNVISNSDKMIEGLSLSSILSSGETQVVVKDVETLKQFSDQINRYYAMDYDDLDELEAITDNIIGRYIEELSSETYISDVSSKESETLIFSLYGGLFFLGIFLSIVFTVAMILIIYYKQIQEGSEDMKRFRIMKKVGLTNRDISKTINSQVWLLFFLPLIIAIVHMLFAYNIINRLLSLAAFGGKFLFLNTFVSSILIFIVFYAIIYKITSKIYYNMVTIK